MKASDGVVLPTICNRRKSNESSLSTIASYPPLAWSGQGPGKRLARRHPARNASVGSRSAVASGLAIIVRREKFRISATIPRSKQQKPLSSLLGKLWSSHRLSPVEEFDQIKSEAVNHEAENLTALAAKDELRHLGYLPDDQNLLFGNVPPPPPADGVKHVSEPTSPEMTNVLLLLPPKPYTDILVQRYLSVTNFIYYCLYPPTFSDDYAAWWLDRAHGKSLKPEFTCLLIRVCACSLQYLDAEIQQKIESDLGESVQTLSENYHHAAKQLSNTIDPGKGGLTQIQQLFLTGTWFKSESLFVETWHTLSSCIHEAQEIGMHKSAPKAGLSEFEVEMRRRLWCLLYIWDWQMSLLLGRPPIINPLYSSFELPNLQLENVGVQSAPPSPVTHIAAQCQLGGVIAGIPATMAGTHDTSKADSIKSHIKQWLLSLHPAYREIDPDTQWDDKHEYVPLQRRQLHVIGYMTMLLPFKPLLVKTFDSKSLESERLHRKMAVNIALHLMEVTRRLFDQVFPIYAKFHLVTFLIFDTAAFFCSALIHDKDGSLPRRDEVVQAITLACSLMGKLAPITKTGAICYPVLARLVRSLSKSAKASTLLKADGEVPNLADDSHGFSLGLESISLPDGISPEALPSFDSMAAPDVFFPASLNVPLPDMETSPPMGVGDLTDVNVGQFDQIWDWQNLDLALMPFAP
ncbi:hypothetical protein N7492_006925 [Penicillium capsulatum]|uniref:Xylanolytic transcriptional activator regulatory domain-containing protein n=1 Tax=Penicillium capsulatum TaxID=69766 RepID=A0A9W9I144_9EURO|nr:hypothetical protein N7492_006925 [Penicillium capsulatum]KAJ6116758.1 hypothetical protein N7512_006483 [Penicillium capsulatum]